MQSSFVVQIFSTIRFKSRKYLSLCVVIKFSSVSRHIRCWWTDIVFLFCVILYVCNILHIILYLVRLFVYLGSSLIICIHSMCVRRSKIRIHCCCFFPIYLSFSLTISGYRVVFYFLPFKLRTFAKVCSHACYYHRIAICVCGTC